MSSNTNPYDNSTTPTHKISDEVVIEMKGIHKAFGDREILKGVDIKVRRGEVMVLLGGSGTGKSVSIRHIIGLLKPDQGDVLIDGESMVHASKSRMEKLRGRMGVLFQSGALINWLSVYDNVALPLREHRLVKDDEIDAIVKEKLKYMGLMPAMNLLPSNISGGMKKRAGIARALTTNPEILLYDEPTSGLDPVLSQVFNELVRKVQRELNVTQVVVTHDMASAYYIADRITFLYQGQVEMVGTPDEIRNTDNPVVQQFIQGKTKGPLILDAGDPTTRKKA
ncbi:MAG: ABC transporter ATP-binding protein [Spirochaetaceae bacterium]|nr:ABC transporter ATP-binding protein [Spirochaetaceae bacterium]|tara:strand:- start:281735 stop:282577 length:843 start_codon:yes stop_codon:yes gene_type:complete